ncbi:hypothetical protein MMC12_007837 [Toensbergia leucococca]|nr:hypothetical protein [Toensbergia leucococca]
MSSATDPARRRINALEVVISLCFTYALCIFGMRLWMRRNLYGLDDLIALIATVSSAQDDRPVFPPDRSNLWLTATFQVLAVAQYATQYLALAVGLGRSSQYLETDSKLSTLNNASFAGVILFLLTLYASKCGAIALTSRFAQPGRHTMAVYCVFGLCIVLGLASVMEVTIGCGVTSAYYWDLSAKAGHCSSQYTRWKVATAFDVATEIIILVLPVPFIWILQMPTTKKIVVLLTFSIRLPVLALSITRNYYIHSILSAPDPGLASNNVIIFQTIEMTVSLAAATLMTLRPFTKDFNTGFGLGGDAVGNYGASGYDNNGYMASSGSNAVDNSRLGSSKGGGKSVRTNVVELQERTPSRPKVKSRMGSLLSTAADASPSDRKHLKKMENQQDSETSTVVTYDPSGFERVAANEIMVTKGVEQSVHPKSIV